MREGAIALAARGTVMVLALGIGWHLVDWALDCLVLRKNERSLTFQIYSAVEGCLAKMGQAKMAEPDRKQKVRKSRRFFQLSIVGLKSQLMSPT